jgi:hypothetical protein
LTATASTYSRADSDTLRAGAGRWFEFAYMLTVITLSTLNVVGVAWGLAFLYVAYAVLDRENGFVIPVRLALGVLPLVLLFLIGLPGYLYHISTDAYRDMWYVSNTIISICAGYLWYSRTKRLGDLIDILVIGGSAGAISSIYELYAHWSEILLLDSLDRYRGIVGFGGAITVSAIAGILICQSASFKDSLFLRYRWLRYFAVSVLLAGVVVCFSRSLYTCLLLCYVVASTRRRLGYRLAGIVIVVLAIQAYALTTPAGNNSYVSQFFAKVSTSANEVSTSHFWSAYEVNENWRGYESYRVLDTFEHFDLAHQIFGGGFGQLVDLRLQIRLGQDTFTKIPIFHSGYNYALIKTGVLGTLMMSVFFIRMLWISVNSMNGRSKEVRILARLMLWMTITIIVTQWTTPGLFPKSDISGLFLLGVGLGATV